tara:strand:+ start:894 stop:1472 length:579 start_codon:yes stop_codon:yes gene_type:complete
MYKKILIFLILDVLLFASCKKEVTPNDLTYNCECGSLSFDGAPYQLTDAHWITLANDTDDFGIDVITGKDYYTTTKIELEGEVEPHHLNMRVVIPALSEGDLLGLSSVRFFQAHPDSNNVTFIIEEVNFNSLSPLTKYVVTAGAFELIQGAPGAVTDDITFELDIAPSLDGITPLTTSSSFSGSFLADKEEL